MILSNEAYTFLAVVIKLIYEVQLINMKCFINMKCN